MRRQEEGGLGSGRPAPSQEEIDLGAFDLHGGRAPRLREPKPVEDTRAQLAFSLVVLIGGVILGLFVLLWFERITGDEFEKLAGLLLAPLVGLLGAATGYYYGRAGRA